MAPVRLRARLIDQIRARPRARACACVLSTAVARKSCALSYLFLGLCPLSNGKHITLESDKFSLETDRKDARNSINRWLFEMRFTRAELRVHIVRSRSLLQPTCTGNTILQYTTVFTYNYFYILIVCYTLLPNEQWTGMLAPLYCN